MSVEQKRCPRCETVKPLTDFYRDRTSKTGASSRCKDCENARKRASPDLATPLRIIMNRARGRALQDLRKMHTEEYEHLVEIRLKEAKEQARKLEENRALQAMFENEEAIPMKLPPVRLRPGRRKPGEAERVDINWCAECSTYHDNDHVGSDNRPKLTIEEIIEDVEFLLGAGEHPDRIYKHVGAKSAASLATRLRNHGRPDLGEAFNIKVNDDRRKSA